MASYHNLSFFVLALKKLRHKNIHFLPRKTNREKGYEMRQNSKQKNSSFLSDAKIHGHEMKEWWMSEREMGDPPQKKPKVLKWLIAYNGGGKEWRGRRRKTANVSIKLFGIQDAGPFLCLRKMGEIQPTFSKIMQMQSSLLRSLLLQGGDWLIEGNSFLGLPLAIFFGIMVLLFKGKWKDFWIHKMVR